MKKILLSIFILFGIFLLPISSAFAVHVNGYYRSNGTYVNGYERTAPDGNPYNNYSFPGNYNPNTGRITGGNPDTYLNNYYDNSSGSTYSPSYSYPTTPTIPTCPMNSYYDGISSCKCNSGYVVSGGSCVSTNSVCYSQLGYNSSYDSLSNTCKCNYGYSISGGSCVSNDIICHNQIGYSSSYDSLSDKCKCNYGYVIGTSGLCVSTSSYCLDQLGLMSQYNSLSKKCECMSGYEFNGSNCVYKKIDYSSTSTKINCPPNSHASITDATKCQCDSGYQANSTKDACVLITTSTKTNDQACSDKYGINSNWDGTKTADGLLNCGCQTGYSWNSSKTACQAIPVLTPNVNYPTTGSGSFVSSLQVGSSGSQVVLLQTLLTKLGNFSGDITGYYGNMTKAAVIMYQTSHNISTTGTVGPKTRTSLNTDLSSQ